jgi:hypothetical protein
MFALFSASWQGRKTWTRNAPAGNAIVEYALPGAVILVVCIGLLAALGAGLNGKFGLMKKDMTAKANAAQSQEQQHRAQKNAFQAAMAEVYKTGGGSSSGGSFDAGRVSPEELTKVIQTAGANGGTETLASALKKYAEQLKAQGNVSDEQLSILTQMANAGHDMAQAEKALQDAATSGKGTVNYNGQTYALDDFRQQFGFDNRVGIDGAISMDPSNAQSQLAPFMKLYAQAQSSGALKDPAVEETVTYLSKQIVALSDLSKWNTTTSPKDLGYAYTTAMDQLDIKGPPKSISDATHKNSGGICGAGNGNDSGTRCRH